MQRKSKNLTPTTAVLEGLALIGKPFYFLVSRLVIGIIFLLYLTGHLATLLFNNIAGLFRPKKKIVKRKKKAKKTPKIRIKFPSFRLPNFFAFFKIEGLRINLFELKIASKFKNLFRKIFKVLKNRKLKLRTRFVLPFILVLILASSFYV